MVSIHAPAWGATGSWKDIVGLTNVSIHAPAWGATADNKPSLLAQSVSIHAPAWGATQPDNNPASARLFQSTPPHGGRH